jgi:hypothetical protein
MAGDEDDGPVGIVTPTTVRLRLPVGWQELDPRGADFDAEFDRAVRAVWHADRLDPVVARLGARLKAAVAGQDVLLVGFTGEVVRSPDQSLTGVVTASVTLVLTAMVDDLERLRSRLSADEPELTVRTVSLPAGDAVLAAGVSVAPEGVPVFRCEYFLPVPDSGLLAVLAFRTPNTGLADGFTAVFDAVARSAEFGSAD